jgi:hypothetical protein
LLTRAPGLETVDYEIQLEPPPFERLIRLESEEALRERIRQERRDKQTGQRATIPEEEPLIEERYQPRTFPLQGILAEPSYLCYGRLLFEDRNSERYGWDLGIIQPVVSTALFYADVVTLPYHRFSAPLYRHDSSAGECLPGDPVPYLLYPPGFSVTGAMAEAGAIVGLIAIFP